MQLTVDFAGLLVLDRLNEDMKRSNTMNEATWVKSNSKEENFNQLWQGIGEVKETLGKLTHARNEKQNLENKLNGIQKRWLNMRIS